MRAWAEIAKALAGSMDPTDRKLSASIVEYVSHPPSVRAMQFGRTQRGQQPLPGMNSKHEASVVQVRARVGPEVDR